MSQRALFASLGLKTQADVDAKIDLYIDYALTAERRRDRCEWESADYWRHHDTAVLWHCRAEALMPGKY